MARRVPHHRAFRSLRPRRASLPLRFEQRLDGIAHLWRKRCSRQTKWHRFARKINRGPQIHAGQFWLETYPLLNHVGVLLPLLRDELADISFGTLERRQQLGLAAGAILI